ncbi:MAG TPA: complex I NDUFA9 subunit family protein [Gaiellaceae bacterium]|nr:complex I NDUFA9 subunit family protein [Gaiellaceae bacterium]
MKVLVTGGTGFVGPHVVGAINNAGHELKLLVRDSTRSRELPGQPVVGEMTNPVSLKTAAEGVDVVVHLVAIRQGREQEFKSVMEQGTRDLVTAAKDAGVKRFVLMSALGTSDETKDLVPYYHAKWEMEQAVKASGLDHVIFRPSFVFGREGGILPTFRKLAKLTPVTPIIGSGEQRIQPIWADDVAAYFAAAIDKPEASSRTFELGGPDAVSWNEFWRRLRSASGIRRRPTVHVPVGLMRVNALVTERLPGNIPLTRDLLTMLEHGDNVVSNDDAVQTFQLPLASLDEQLRRAA